MTRRHSGQQEDIRDNKKKFGTTRRHNEQKSDVVKARSRKNNTNADQSTLAKPNNNNHSAVTWVLACGVGRELVGRAELSLKMSVTKMAIIQHATVVAANGFFAYCTSNVAES
jgi:hypothetical protein